MATPTHRGILERAADRTTSHPVAAPIGWGPASGLTLGAYFIGSFDPGHVVARADVAGAGRMRSVGAFLSGARSDRRR